MKILFFVSSMNAGGAERVAATLSSAWVRRGDLVTLVPTYGRKGTCFYTLNPGVRLIWLADRLGWLGRTVVSPVAKWFALRRVVREIQPDVIVSFLTNVNVTVLYATRGMGIPVIVCERTNPEHSTAAGKWLPRLRQRSYPWASTVVVQSSEAVGAMEAVAPGLKRVRVLPNPLPTELLSIDTRPEPGSPRPARQTLVAMGRLVPSKQFDILIQMFAALMLDHPDWDLVIWGDGPLRTALQQQIDDAGLGERIALGGRTDQPWQVLARADLFVMTSRVEGFPNVLLEAMALGRACVAFDCPSGPREMTENGKYALLVPLDDQRGFSHALSQLMSDATLREVMGRRAALFVRERYSLERTLDLWDGVLNEAIATEHAPS